MKTNALFILYCRHEDRDKALRLCSWPLERDSQYLIDFIDHLETAKAYTRAATIAVFNLKLQLAIEILNRAPNDTDYGSTLNVVAMALSGFSDEPNSMWRQNCSICINKLSDPYLKAMFSFLTALDYNYDDVLVCIFNFFHFHVNFYLFIFKNAFQSLQLVV